jgi:hypothetical protein
VHPWDGKPLSKIKRNDGDNRSRQKDANLLRHGHLEVPFLNNFSNSSVSSKSFRSPGATPLAHVLMPDSMGPSTTIVNEINVVDQAR